MNRVPDKLIIHYGSRDVIAVEVCERNVGVGVGVGVGGGGGCRGLNVTLFKAFLLELTGNEPRTALRTV